MPRLSWTWSVLVLVLISLGVSIWRISLRGDEEGISRENGALQPAPITSPVARSSGPDGQASSRPTESSLNLPAPSAPPASLGEQAKADWIQDYCETLVKASYADDLASLEQLLADLGSPELEISETAHNSLMARHDKRAIPHLEAMLKGSISARDRQQIESLIEFLNTKSIFDSDRFKKR